MVKYIAQRLFGAIPVLFGVSILVFGMMHLIPGDPVRIMFRLTGEDQAIPPEQYEEIQKRYGFDKPVPIQYLTYIARLAQGDMGESIIRRRPVSELVVNEVPFTAELAVSSMLFATIVGVFLGVLAALGRGGWWDTGSMIGATFGVSLPSFWFGLILMLIFSVYLGWLPVSGQGSPEYLVLPAITLGISAAASIARLTRSSLLEVLNEDYVRTARAKGLAEVRVIAFHALRNSLIPVVTLLGLQFGHLLAGAVVVETVFARRGIGSLILQAVTSKDFPLAQGLVMVVAISYVLINLLIDVLYGFLDPRIRFE